MHQERSIDHEHGPPAHSAVTAQNQTELGRGEAKERAITRQMRNSGVDRRRRRDAVSSVRVRLPSDSSQSKNVSRRLLLRRSFGLMSTLFSCWISIRGPLQIK